MNNNNSLSYEFVYIQKEVSEITKYGDFKKIKKFLDKVNIDKKLVLFETAIEKSLMEYKNVKFAFKLLNKFEKIFFSLNEDKKEENYHVIINIYTYFIQFFCEDFITGKKDILTKYQIKNLKGFLLKQEPHIEYVIKNKFGKDVFYYAIIPILNTLIDVLWLSINSDYIDKELKEKYITLAQMLIDRKNKISYKILKQYIFDTEGDIKTLIKILISDIEEYLGDLLVEMLLEDI